MMKAYKKTKTYVDVDIYLLYVVYHAKHLLRHRVCVYNVNKANSKRRDEWE